MKKFYISLILLSSILLFVTSVSAESNYIIDNADLLSETTEIELNKKIFEFKNVHNADIVILTTSTLEGKYPRDYADDFYDYNGYNHNGVLLLISTQENDVYISTSGNGIDAFTDYGINKALDEIVSLFSNGVFDIGVEKFISISDEYFTLAENGTPYDKSSVPTTIEQIIIIIIIIWVISFIISLIIVNNMRSKLISIRAKSNANDYIQNKNIDLVNSNDIFLYRNISRVRIPKDNGGSSSHRGSSGRMHGGGGRKF